MSETDSTEVESAKRHLDVTVTPSELYQTLEHCLSARDADGAPKEQASVMVWGAMGIGKSDICRTIGKLWNLRVIALHLPQFDPTDLKGIPIMDESRNVRWVPSSYLPQFLESVVDEDCTEASFNVEWEYAEDIMVHIYNPKGEMICRANDQMQGDLNKDENFDVSIEVLKGTIVVKGEMPRGTKIHIIDKAIIFLDELSAAVPEVQNAALQLVLDKRVGEYDVPPFTPLVAAGNRESDQAFVSPMSMPLCNRFMHVRLVPSLADWTDWAVAKRKDASIIGYLQWKKQSLFHFEPDTITEGDCGFPTPRSWSNLSDQMPSIERLPKHIQAVIITGFIGKAIGRQFIEHREVADQLPDTDEILRGKYKAGTHDLSELNVGAKWHLAMGLCYSLADYHETFYDENIPKEDVELQPEEWQTAAHEFCQFIDDNLGKEMTILCVHIVSRHLDISFVKFRGTKFPEFAKRYREILRRTV